MKIYTGYFRPKKNYFLCVFSIFSALTVHICNRFILKMFYCFIHPWHVVDKQKIVHGCSTIIVLAPFISSMKSARFHDQLLL